MSGCPLWVYHYAACIIDEMGREGGVEEKCSIFIKSEGSAFMITKAMGSVFLTLQSPHQNYKKRTFYFKIKISHLFNQSSVKSSVKQIPPSPIRIPTFQSFYKNYGRACFIALGRGEGTDAPVYMSCGSIMDLPHCLAVCHSQ